MKNNIILFLIIVFLSQCKEERRCDKTFVIKGRIMNGTTGKWWIHMPVHFYGYDAKKDRNLGDIGTTTTDSQGNFELSYQCSDLKADQINVSTDIGDYFGLPFNEDVTRTIYFSTLGKIKVNFKTNSPLNSDTLYFSYPYLMGTHDSIIIRAFTQADPPPSFTIRTPVPRLNFFWARGKNNLAITPAQDGYTKFQKSTTGYLSGDPYTDSVLINY